MELPPFYQILGFFSIFFYRCLDGSENVHFLQGNEYSSFTDSLAFAAVYFHVEKSEHHIPQFEDHFNKAARSLESYGITFVKTSCYSSDEFSCSNVKKSTLGLFSYGKLLKRFPLQEVFDENAMVAHILQTVLQKELRLIYSESEFSQLLSESKGANNIVLGYVEGYGTKKHRYMMEVGFVYGDNFTFALTTNEKLANKYGMPSLHDARLWIFFCKDVVNRTQDCNSIHYNGKISVLPLASFIQLQTLPRAVLMPPDGITIYDKVKLPINKVYLFNDEFLESDLSQLSQMSKELSAAVGFVLVNIKEQRTWLPRFGLSEQSQFPAIAFAPPFSSADGIPISLDVVTDDQVSLTFPNVKKMISNYLENPEKFQEQIVQASSLQVIDVHQYEEISLSGLKMGNKMLVSFCPKDYGVCDRYFERDFRRLVRSLDRDSRVKMSIVFVHCSQDDCKNILKIDEFPTLRLHVPKHEIDKDFYSYHGDPSYEAMLQFVREKLQLLDIVSVPSSTADDVAIIPPETEDKELDSEAEEEEEETIQLKKEDNDEDKDVDVPIQETEDPEPDYGLSKEETEDDEVAGALNKFRTWFIEEEKIPMLTDKTINMTRDQYDVLVVHFFMPWSTRSLAFKDQYVQAATKINGDKSLPLKTLLVGVNCFDWPDVCHRFGIMRYPTIMMYTPHGEIQYKGPLDEKNILKTVKLLQYPADGWSLESLDDAEACLYDKKSEVLGDIVLIGLFTENNKNEMRVFKLAANMMYGKFLVVKATGNIAVEMGRKFDVQTPSIVLVKRSDPLEPFIVYSDMFSTENILKFTVERQLHAFGQLTPANLPLYFQRNQPFVIVFRGDEDQMYSPGVTEIVKMKAFPHVNFCWMNGSDSAGVQILKAYTKETMYPALVYIDFAKNEIHHFRSSSLDVSEIKNWIKHCLSSHNEPTGYLQYGYWKPALPGYDFLAMIDQEQGQTNEETSDEDQEEKVQELEEVASSFEERKRLRKVRPTTVNSGTHNHQHTEL